MLTATTHRTRRRHGGLGAIRLPDLVPGTRPTLSPGGGIEQPVNIRDPQAPGYINPPFPGGGKAPTPTKPYVMTNWLTVTVGPTADSGQGTQGGTVPPAPQNPATTAADIVIGPSGGGGGSGGNDVPTATVPTAEVVVTPTPQKRPWWPWAVGAAVVAAVGAFVVTR